ncbi:MAG: Thiamin pyrophosphokinase [uncultured Truepera sp.]|uniref:Thiamine diphosphokinase n=1 Tax=uncultured Truepera sp. TaxID=543023 RepID=A0A6J4VH54_9DEIN|nr:MAG: Thiamin pyrophosphokinase [uncultured Truepera sp.]
MKALVLAGSDIVVTDMLESLCRVADFVVAADSGVRHAAALGVVPDLIVGDFDSAREADLELYPEVPHRAHPPRKDALDLELALTEATARGAAELLIVGALGGRLDQTLAALLIAARYRETHRVTLHSGDAAAYPLKAGEVLSLELAPGQTFSVLSLAPVSTISLGSASYPLARAELPFGVGLGVSNEVLTSPLSVTLHGGSALLLVDFTGFT